MTDDDKYPDDSGAGDAQLDARLDALLQRFGGDYNPPPDFVPREEMWHAISAEREPRRILRMHPGWGMLAATVLLGVGIGIGFEARSRATGAPQVGGATTSTLAAVPARADSVPPATVASVRDSMAPTVAARPVRALPHDVYASTAATPAANPNARSAAYTLAAVRHFTAVEALLTSYETAPHDSRGDAQMAAWARALLSQTRLLLDSPAAQDPARNKLLLDLELVLVQMTQLTPADTSVDREMIEGSVRRSDVITRLRTAVPAGGTTHL
jgi:hypothetical protein